ncbi:hypothetical protein MKX03_014798 [Papaver bracteatum]|nr:hypothetical protein MKX03_014798 [Papaver bracteatum]
MVEEEPKEKKIPVLPWMRAPINVNLIEDILLEHVPKSRLVEALSNINENFTTLYPIQYAVWKQTIGPGQFERDLCINSPTGSGKTAYCSIYFDKELISFFLFESIAPALGLIVGSTIGGKGKMSDEISQLIRRPAPEAGVWYYPEKELESGVDILVATPGKLMDLINTTKGFTLDGTERGFKGKPSPRLVKMILSGKLSKLDLHHPLFLTTGRYQLPDKLQLFKLVCFLEQFVTKQSKYKTLENFREGKIQELIASESDAITRGMDVAGVRNVINYVMPFHVRTYIHRAGRTARAGNSGRCFTFLARNQVFLSKFLDKKRCRVVLAAQHDNKAFHVNNSLKNPLSSASS